MSEKLSAVFPGHVRRLAERVHAPIPSWYAGQLRKPAGQMRRRWLTIVELWDDANRWKPTHWLCAFGLHWPIKWDEAAYPACYDPPEPPEPDFACQSCGKIREPIGRGGGSGSASCTSLHTANGVPDDRP